MIHLIHCCYVDNGMYHGYHCDIVSQCDGLCYRSGAVVLIVLYPDIVISTDDHSRYYRKTIWFKWYDNLTRPCIIHHYKYDIAVVSLLLWCIRILLCWCDCHLRCAMQIHCWLYNIVTLLWIVIFLIIGGIVIMVILMWCSHRWCDIDFFICINFLFYFTLPFLFVFFIFLFFFNEMH